MITGCIEVMISLSAVNVTVVFTLVVCCMKYKRKAEYFYKLQSQRTHHSETSSEIANVHYNQNTENAYDLIDEEIMIGGVTLVHYSPARDNRRNQNRVRHSLTVDQEENSSSNSEVDITNSSPTIHINPYQQMTDVDVHAYTYCPLILHTSPS